MPSPYSPLVDTADGVQTDFTFSFPYLDQDHVVVLVDGVDPGGWTFHTAQTIRFSVAPSNGAIVRIERQTSPTERLVNFGAAASLNEEDMDTDGLQAFYLAQETRTRAEEGLFEGEDGTYSVNGRRISNAADPVNPQDITTMAWVLAQPSSNIAAAQQAASDAQAAAAQAAATSSSLQSQIDDLATDTELNAVGLIATQGVTDAATASAAAAAAQATADVLTPSIGRFSANISNTSDGSGINQGSSSWEHFYVKIGPLCFYDLHFANVTDAGPPSTDSVYITGLPFTFFDGDIDGQAIGAVGVGNIGTVQGNKPAKTVQGIGGTSALLFIKDDGSPMTYADLAGSDVMKVTGVFWVG